MCLTKHRERGRERERERERERGKEQVSHTHAQTTLRLWVFVWGHRGNLECNLYDRTKITRGEKLDMSFDETRQPEKLRVIPAHINQGQNITNPEKERGATGGQAHTTFR